MTSREFNSVVNWLNLRGCLIFGFNSEILHVVADKHLVTLILWLVG